MTATGCHRIKRLTYFRQIAYIDVSIYLCKLFASVHSEVVFHWLQMKKTQVIELNGKRRETEEESHDIDSQVDQKYVQMDGLINQGS